MGCLGTGKTEIVADRFAFQDIEECFHYLGVELSALLLIELRNDLIQRALFAVWPAEIHRVERINDSQHP